MSRLPSHVLSSPGWWYACQTNPLLKSCWCLGPGCKGCRRALARSIKPTAGGNITRDELKPETPWRWTTRRCFKKLKEGFFLFFFYFPGLFWWFITFLSGLENLVFLEGDRFNVHKKFWIDSYREWSSLLRPPHVWSLTFSLVFAVAWTSCSSCSMIFFKDHCVFHSRDSSHTSSDLRPSAALPGWR